MDLLFENVQTVLARREQYERLTLTLQPHPEVAGGVIMAKLGEAIPVAIGTAVTKRWAWRVLQACKKAGAPPQVEFLQAIRAASYLTGEMPSALVTTSRTVPRATSPVALDPVERMLV